MKIKGKFRKKPIVIDAFLFLAITTCEELYEWAGIPYEIGQEPKPAPLSFKDGIIHIWTIA